MKCTRNSAIKVKKRYIKKWLRLAYLAYPRHKGRKFFLLKSRKLSLDLNWCEGTKDEAVVLKKLQHGWHVKVLDWVRPWEKERIVLKIDTNEIVVNRRYDKGRVKSIYFIFHPKSKITSKLDFKSLDKKDT